jgi:hypothetical protein
MKTFKMLLPGMAILTMVNCVFAQTWTQTSAPSNSWAFVASSADGSKLVAAAIGGSIYISTNSGTDWTLTSAPSASWESVASSADGTKLVATGSGQIYVSTNSGSDWTLTSAPNNSWVSVASSADGNKLVAEAPTANPVYTSVDSGTTWTPINGLNSIQFSPCSVASTVDGTKLVSVGFRVYYSTNSGTNWMQPSMPLTVNSTFDPSQVIALSADGTKWAVARPYNGTGTSPAPIYTTTNSGDSWSLTSAPSNKWNSVAMSSDGNKIVAVAGGSNFQGLIYTSTNFGVNWTAANVPSTNWISVASSADGNKLVAAVRNGGIWISQTTPSPQLNLTPTNGGFKLSWLIPSTNFVMQQSSDLASWSNVTNAPVLNLTNLQNELVLSPTNSSGFYRLKTP